MVNKQATEPLKVVIITPFAFVAAEIANRLTRRNISVLLVLPLETKKIIKNAEFEKRIITFFISKNVIKDMIKIAITLFSFNPHVILMYSGGGVLGLLMSPFVKICQIFFGAKIVSCVMEPVPRIGIHNPSLAWIETKLEVKSANLIITDTEKLKRIIVKVHKVSPTKIVAFTNEWDAPCFYRWRMDNISEEKWILFFGTALEHKGLEYLIQAEPLITKKHPDAKIVIAGKGQEKYYSFIKNRDKYILLNRFIDYKEGALLFQKSMIIVLPYITGTVSGIIPVAYAFKKPIVATKVGCFDEVIEHGKTGILVPPRNPKALAEAITMLLENKDKRREMGEAGFSKLKTDLSWDKFVDRLMDIYKYRKGNSIINRNST